MDKSSFKVKPVGGVGQIGSNMCLVEGQSHQFLIDAGILFPYEEVFDLNYLIPDMSGLPRTVSDLIITHGHEDHIGCVIHVLEHFPDINIHAPPFAAELIRQKLNFNKISAKINVYCESQTLQIGPFAIDPIRVNHSIPDTFGLLIQNKDVSTCLFYVSDFKIDLNSSHEKPFDFKKLKSRSKEFTRKILLADSTNILSKTFKTPGEDSLNSSLDKIMGESPSRVFLTTFSSNVHRIKNVFESAKKNGRKIVAYGRSIERYLEAANTTGEIKLSDYKIHDASSIDCSAKNLLVIVSGCQADFKSAVRRIITGNDTYFQLGEDDTFVFSSKEIPGNEKKIAMIKNDAWETGAKVISHGDMPIHVSGHPGREDLATLYKEYNPDLLIPIHGETEFLYKHRDFFLEKDPNKDVLILKNHDSLSISRDGVKTIACEEPLKPILIHGKGIPIEREKISQRRKMASTGSVLLSFYIKSGKINNFELTPLGLPAFLDQETELESLKASLKSVASTKKIKDLNTFGEEMRIATRRLFNEKLGYKPLTIIHVLE